ncbi:hypothetical protein [Chondrinema litorale]|uniref:hypothetical protein n=1 Tax=Chondrinema litorale TaxID=2994555 RepID=UPI0025438CC0|nr:hypothetical protein [Chondrinema litorale]UZR99821.1 hypothetical protein OQ292_38615 [Chondrinema litorale]
MLFSLIISAVWVLGCLIFFYLQDNSDKLIASTQEESYSEVEPNVHTMESTEANFLSADNSSKEPTQISDAVHRKGANEGVQNPKNPALIKQKNKSIFIDFNSPDSFH